MRVPPKTKKGRSAIRMQRQAAATGREVGLSEVWERTEIRSDEDGERSRVV